VRRATGERRLAGEAQRGQIVDQVAQHEQVDEVAEAIVDAIDGTLADGMELLGDLEAQWQAGDRARAGELEVLQADRIDVLGLVGVDFGADASRRTVAQARDW
jgi:hypothetical protein